MQPEGHFLGPIHHNEEGLKIGHERLTITLATAVRIYVTCFWWVYLNG
jgi:hypothetical protein